MNCAVGVHVLDPYNPFSMCVLHLFQMFVELEIAVHHRAERRCELVEGCVFDAALDGLRDCQDIAGELRVQPHEGCEARLGLCIAVMAPPAVQGAHRDVHRRADLIHVAAAARQPLQGGVFHRLGVALRHILPFCVIVIFLTIAHKF